MNNIFYIVNIEAAIFKQDRWLMVYRSVAEEHAAGDLSLIGGKVEISENSVNVFEKTLKREIMEEVGISVNENMQYLKSSSFILDNGIPVIDVVFLCSYKDGVPDAMDKNEVSSFEWLTYNEINSHPDVKPWTKESLKKAEETRLQNQDIII